jgi:uncharacterized protein YjeT (DUF2065 family)
MRRAAKLSNVRAILACGLGICLAVNGFAMLAAPATWYEAVPGVTGTGAFNPHFIRDIGAAYLVSGTALLWFGRFDAARPAAQVGAAFLALHAIVHLWDAAAGREHVHALLLDVPSVILPAILAAWIVWPSADGAESAPKQAGATHVGAT